MKKLSYIIVCDNHSFSTYGGRIETRDYLICWYPNAVCNFDDPFWDMGLTWTSFEYLIDCNKKIAENSIQTTKAMLVSNDKEKTNLLQTLKKENAKKEFLPINLER